MELKEKIKLLTRAYGVSGDEFGLSERLFMPKRVKYGRNISGEKS